MWLRIRKLDNYFCSRPRNLWMAIALVTLSNTLFNFIAYSLKLIFYNPFFSVTELPFCLIFSSLIFFSTGSLLLSLLIVNFLNLLSYVKFLFLMEGLFPTDVLQLDELVSVIPTWGQALFVVLGLFFVFFVVVLWNGRFLVLRSVVLGVLLAGFTFSILIPETIVTQVRRFALIEGWNKKAEFRWNGFYFSFYRSLVEHQILLHELSRVALLKQFPRFDLRSVDLSGLEEKRNLYVVLLESFIHPSELKNFSYKPNPVTGYFKRAGDEPLSNAYSPTFGGESARVEFEFLCGVPEFDMFGAVTLNWLGLRHVPCLPGLLAEVGYRTVASTPVPGYFYNYKTAYRTLGFSETHFDADFEMEDLDGLWLSNESTLLQNLSRVRSYLADNPKRPLFNYVVLMSGHAPFKLNEERRPLRIIVEPSGHALWDRIVNSSYYTMVALNDYIAALKRMDPDAIVLLITDHLPPLPNREYLSAGYQGFNPQFPITSRRVFLSLLDRFEGVPAGNVAYWEVPYLLLALLVKEDRCANRDCLFESPFMIRLPGVFLRSDPKASLCQDQQCPANLLDVQKNLSDLRSVYLHLVKASNLPGPE